jgi:hypothetical protein
MEEFYGFASDFSSRVYNKKLPKSYFFKNLNFSNVIKHHQILCELLVVNPVEYYKKERKGGGDA